jgi:branched-subunit amino acid ABC-type transport system permease component
MSDLLPFVVIGLTAGSVYGLAATGLVLTYRTSGLFNFAHGAVAAVGAYAFYELHHQRGLPAPLAALVCLAAVAPVLGLALERLAARLAEVRPALQVVATIGLLLLIQGLVAGVYGAEARYVPPFLPTTTVTILGARVGIDQILVIAVSALGSLGLAAVLRRSRLGAAMRAVVDDPELLDVTGYSPAKVRRSSWLIGATFAVASGMLIAPTIGLDALLLTFLVVQAFGAAAIGRFQSLGLTYVGGLAIGVGAALATRELAGVKALAGLAPSLPFLVLFATLVVRPRRLTHIGRPVRMAQGEIRRLSAPLRRTAVAAGVVATLAVPELAGVRLPVFTTAAALLVVLVSMVVLVNLSGQVSLCHAAFAALGATTFSHLAGGAGLPWGVAFVAAGILAVPLGLVVALPAIRLSGLYLALATFGLGVLLERMVYGTGFMFGASGTRPAPRPGVFGLASDSRFFYLAAGIAALACVLAGLLCRSRLGRLLRAMSDSPLGLSTFGLSVNVTRVLVFCLSAVIAAEGGALLAAGGGSASAVGFDATRSLLWLAALAIGGRGLIKPALVAVTGLAVAPSYFPTLFADWGAALFGAAALVAALAGDGRLDLEGRLARAADAASWRGARSPVTARLAQTGAPS